ncbi:hypothetical protein BDF22DRAFT_681591 [Syncephalis plumigaleata]|nr:hypothetical protein BDF22DRAFT_681591 [Syncephalis plumigaleata]
MYLLLLPLFSVICLYATLTSCFDLYFYLFTAISILYLPTGIHCFFNKLAYVFMHPSLLIPYSFVTSQSVY